MSPTQARTFYAVAMAGSFTAAAKALHVSQPTVTTQIKDLERLYDVELFLRHARGVTLTPSGRELMEIVRRIDASQKDAVEYLLTAQGLRAGHLRVGAYGAHDVVKVLAEFNRRYPEPEVTVSFANSRTLQEQLLNHDLDVVVFTRWEPSRELYTLPYRHHSYQVAVFGLDHAWRQRKSVTVEQLTTQTVIIREPGSEARRATEHVLKQAKAPPGKMIQVGSREGVMSAVAEGIGVSTIFDEGLVPEQAVKKLPIAGARLDTHVDVVCLAERKDTRIIAAFLEIAEECRPRD
ncbi:MAG: LysR substrate-binding domain-containing protein [Gammaproteobacteria bacterium]